MTDRFHIPPTFASVSRPLRTPPRGNGGVGDSFSAGSDRRLRRENDARLRQLLRQPLHPPRQGSPRCRRHGRGQCGCFSILARRGHGPTRSSMVEVDRDVVEVSCCVVEGSSDVVEVSSGVVEASSGVVELSCCVVEVSSGVVEVSSGLWRRGRG